MKIIVAGSTSFVATEVIRQALSNPAITSIVALGRRTVEVPQNTGPGSDASKFKSIVSDNFENYPESVKKELSGANACIWYTILIAACSLFYLILCNKMVETALFLMYDRLIALTPSKIRNVPAMERRAEDLHRLHSQRNGDYRAAATRLCYQALALHLH